MKHFFIFILSVTASVQSLSQVTWSTPVTVSSGSTYGNLHPRVTLNRSGNPMVLWGKYDSKAYFSRWTGTSFTAPVIIGNAAINVMAQSWAGPDIASYGDTVYVTMKRTPETMNMNKMYISHSYDGGMTFSDTVRIDNIDTNMSRFPVVTTTSTGNPLVTFMKFNASFADPRYVVTRSSDYGMTFSTDVVATGTAGDVCDCCPSTIISSGSKAIMLFRNNLSNIREMWAGVSNDGGITFPGLMKVDTTNWMIMSCPSSGPDGFVIGDSLYTVFMSTSTGIGLVHLSRASISSMTMKHSRITGLFTGLSSQNFPRIANVGNAAAAVWVQNTTPTTPTSKYVAFSFTNNISSGFSGYTTITGATGSGIMNADVAMAPGVIHIVWEDMNTGNVMYVRGTYLVTTSVEPLVSKELIEVYPNPATETFTVSLKNIEDISSCYLTDNVGRNIDLKPYVSNGKAAYSLKGIAKGGYYFILNDATGKTHYSKLIVQ